jgi:hypothetical protein
MSRALSLTSSFFSAAFGILLVLSFLVMGGPAFADVLVGPLTDVYNCVITEGGTSCPQGNNTSCGSEDCCYCTDEWDAEEHCCFCRNATCIGGLPCPD